MQYYASSGNDNQKEHYLLIQRLVILVQLAATAIVLFKIGYIRSQIRSLCSFPLELVVELLNIYYS